VSESDSKSRPTRIAIACQGGGSHTAFTAGVLRGLFRGWDSARFEVVGLSGTSGGAFNAVVAWHALMSDGHETAVDQLGELWTQLAVDGPFDRWLNDVGVWQSMARDMGIPTAQPSPYLIPGSEIGQQRIRDILESLVAFDTIPRYCKYDHPELVVGTIDVEGGVFETFHNEQVTPDAVLASAAIPELFRAVEIDGHAHWDGLFSQNPPIIDLLTVPAQRKPEEIWVIQINSQRRDDVPKTPEQIADRRNELAGNLSLNQELRAINWVNQWVDAGHLPEDEFMQTTVRRIALNADYDPSTKLDRSKSFLDELIKRGEAAAGSFLTSYPAPATVIGDGKPDAH
jgi:NTE family protein